MNTTLLVYPIERSCSSLNAKEPHPSLCRHTLLGATLGLRSKATIRQFVVETFFVDALKQARAPNAVRTLIDALTMAPEISLMFTPKLG
jgi:hypothetical protein